MYVEDIAVDDFIKLFKSGQKLFKNISVEDYTFALENFRLDEVEFQECFININFKNCSFVHAKFIACNLKCVSFDTCNLTGCTISECSIEAMDVRRCTIAGIIFGTNFYYGIDLSSEKCFSHFEALNNAD